MGVNATQQFDTETDLTTESPGGASDGVGGGTMDVWQETRVTKLNQLAASTFTNNSSFSIPSAVVDTQQFDTAFDSNEKFAGVNALGTALDGDEKPLAGKASIEAAGVAFEKQSVSGSFLIAAAPPVGVTAGQDTSLDEYDFRFTPSFAAIDYYEAAIPYHYEAGTIEYGTVEGYVYDYNGNPVPDHNVRGEGDADITDSAGFYQFLAPGGNAVTLQTLYQTYSEEFTPQAGQTLQQDFTFPMLQVTVLDANYDPIEGAPVEVLGDVYHSNEGGQVKLPQVELGEHTVVVQDYWTADITVDSQDQLFRLKLSPSSGDFENPDGETAANAQSGGVKFKAVDAVSGATVVDMSVRETGTDYLTQSGPNGIATILSNQIEQDEVEFHIGTGDRRYRPTTVTGSIPEDDIVEFTVELERRTQVVNA
jgi:hypothetical protein